MKLGTYSNLIASAVLGASFIGGCLIVASSKDAVPTAAVQPAVSSPAVYESPWDKPLLTVDAAAGYLGIPQGQLEKILDAERALRLSSGETNTLPHIIVDGRIYISRTALDTWVLEASMAGRTYVNGKIVK
ncbi:MULTISPECIES: hypothetical protein [unclassified Paenibacillus]|uniref:hypothetical protein n=1 Tax=unclassified Paenibacillus TaxID=185978 RepID=UPI0009545D61|nr:MULTISPECIES: hypothetical protein [unclassified Paenibacillus]ASS68423.1 hypothetical protein CIC07_21515 [Paenibacillus sp. RUD330]SIR32772.1 hypothetical protein SAMN05880555_3489 [Paenibacillus sp. RU4X]SIR43988.1 hypothetical protein SAMN05880570_3490 [Paenibacillus sp. RU4T]